MVWFSSLQWIGSTQCSVFNSRVFHQTVACGASFRKYVHYHPVHFQKRKFEPRSNQHRIMPMYVHRFAKQDTMSIINRGT